MYKKYRVTLTESERQALLDLISAGKVDWHFTTADARIKLNHLYPSIKE